MEGPWLWRRGPEDESTSHSLRKTIPRSLCASSSGMAGATGPTRSPNANREAPRARSPPRTRGGMNPGRTSHAGLLYGRLREAVVAVADSVDRTRLRPHACGDGVRRAGHWRTHRGGRTRGREGPLLPVVPEARGAEPGRATSRVVGVRRCGGRGLLGLDAAPRRQTTRDPMRVPCRLVPEEGV